MHQNSAPVLRTCLPCLRHHRRHLSHDVACITQSDHTTKTETETYDIYLVPPGEDPETCQSWLRMRNRDGRYNLMFEEWVTEGPFIISPRITFEVCCSFRSSRILYLVCFRMRLRDAGECACYRGSERPSCYISSMCLPQPTRHRASRTLQTFSMAQDLGSVC